MNATKSGLRAGLCPKCDSRDIRVQRWSYWNRKDIGLGAWKMAKVHDYACVSCGDLESYIDEQGLPGLAKHWAPLATTGLD